MNIEPILAVTRRLAAPVDLQTMLEEVVAAAKQVLSAERGSVWLYDPATHELVLQVSTGLSTVRVPADAGIVGACARHRHVINVPDCYADPRFNPELDRASNYRTRCMLTLPLVDHKDSLVGVLQVLNKIDGSFDAGDEALAESLAAQCAVALQRAQMTGALIDAEKMRHELEMGRQVQQGTLPSTMPEVAGYALHGMSAPADLTGGDTFDVARTSGGLLLVLGDATGHGLAPALHVTQMHAMLRMALRLGADLDTACFQLNNELADTLPADRFITAFIGLLDTAAHRVRYHSAGQAPILHFEAAADEWHRYKPTGFPLAAMPLPKPRPAREIAMGEGDLLALISDGVYECHAPDGSMFGEDRVAKLLREGSFQPAQVLARRLLEATRAFAQGGPQEDDITILLVRRCIPSAARDFDRAIGALDEVFGFIGEHFERWAIDPGLRMAIDFTVEELFTNMVKYSTMSTARIGLEISGFSGGVQVVLTDRDVDLFDVTQAPDVDVHRPIEERRPGGLGLHLIRRMVDGIEYAYDPSTRVSTTRFHKLRGPRRGGEGLDGTLDNGGGA